MFMWSLIQFIFYYFLLSIFFQRISWNKHERKKTLRDAQYFFLNSWKLVSLSPHTLGRSLETKSWTNVRTWLIRTAEPELTMLAPYFARQPATLLQDLRQCRTLHSSKEELIKSRICLNKLPSYTSVQICCCQGDFRKWFLASPLQLQLLSLE